MRTTKTMILKTADGRQVYGNGCGVYSLVHQHFHVVMALVAGGSAKNREANRARASAQVGVECVWVDGPEVEYGDL